ncbi:hypothetical protein [Ideonella sp. A 288]|uniref:hypothetical protein n=1 Tax=Ideonella sp. A 288 TaxID=1962181 RepID=UPI001185334B|nr:hypothetical protein [Ideonella sp. A 288]
MTRLNRALAAAAMALACSQAAFASIIGFDYIVHIDAVTVDGRPPAGVLPVGPGNAVTGTFAFDTTLTPSFPPVPDVAFYDYLLPSPLVAHHLRFQLPTPLDFNFSNVSYAVVNDASLGNVGLPNTIEDELMVASSFASPTLPNFSTIMFLISLGTLGQPLGPLASLDLPTTPPNLADFNDTNEWNFSIGSPNSDPFTNPDYWTISVQGHLVSLTLAEIPEPPSGVVAVLALAALLWQRAAVRRRGRTFGA